MRPRLHKPLPSLRDLAPRFARHGGVGVALIGGALGIGVLGYHVIAGLDWVDPELAKRSMQLMAEDVMARINAG